MQNDWMKHYQCEWRPSERDLRLRELAERYHAETEAYDRTVCTGPIREGSIMPTTTHETALINRNATNVLKRIVEEAEREGISRRDMIREIGRRA